MKFLKSVIQKIVSFFTSGKAEAAFNAAADLVPKALPIIREIAALTPTRKDDEILAAFDKFNVAPDVAQIRATPSAKRGYLLLQLATDVLAAQLPGIATNILNTAVQLAVTGMKA